ncbi:site-specific integrase [Peribacillus huizhouensis]|uniref:Integrase n=1 Tax=Peribacillus huizhouensis TaxID=1501239 RepID=A0ABR6CRD3_9BACI|nr:site-specific integrase [Peribacillus huizhouensis]MBA9027589.1 integrase [Peribacillus huizhouensis]
MAVSFNEETGNWDFVISAGRNPLTGRRKQVRRRGFATKGEAEEAYLKVKAELKSESFLDKSTMTYEKFMEEYLAERRISLQRSTFETHLTYYENNIKPAIGKLRLQEIQYSHIQTFVNALVGQEYSANTVHLVFRIIYGSLKKAKQRQIIKENPAEGITLPKRGRREMNIWTLDQVNYFLQEAPHIARVTRCLIGFQFGLLAGLRQGEIMGLRWKDIDFDRKIVYVRQTVTQAAEIKPGAKNESSIRSVTIPDRLVEELRKHRKLIEWEKSHCRTTYRDNDLVLPTRDGSPMIPRNFRKEFYNLADKLGLPKIRFHDTRHTHATLLIEQNVNVKLIAERLGHRDIETTLNTYSHVLPNMQRSVSEKLDEILDF